MDSPSIALLVVSPDRKVLEVEAEEVVLPAIGGYLGVRAGHTPLLAALGTGLVSYVRQGRTHYLSIAGGFAEVLPQQVSVLTEAAEHPGEIDVARAEASRDRARRALAEVLNQEDGEFRRAEARLQRAVNRIVAASKHHAE